jgi:hypothetical protein
MPTKNEIRTARNKRWSKFVKLCHNPIANKYIMTSAPMSGCNQEDSIMFNTANVNCGLFKP